MRLFVAVAASTLAVSAGSLVTFNKDVLPILQKNCQGCHRPGEAAPMSFVTYQEARPWAKSIREAVLLKRMPPWFADPAHGKWANDRSLSQAEIDTLTAWSDGGAPEGNAKDRPALLEFPEGWNIGKPDVVIEMPNEFAVPPSGTIEYQYVVIPTGFTEDKWVRMAEVRPGNRALVHHVIAFIRPPGSKWLQEAKPGIVFVPQRRRQEAQPANAQQPANSAQQSQERRRSEGEGSGEFLVGFAPGSMPEVLKPHQGKLIKAGSDIVFQMHYTSNGKAGTDQTRVGLILSSQAATERVLTIAAQNNKFVIPANAGSHRVDAELEIQHDTTLTAFLPHMHLRGKSFEYRVAFPNGESQVLLSVPKYSFNWQLSYYLEKPLLLPKGTKIQCTAHFDNSANNPDNPDPSSEVRWGDQSWEEMMIGFMDVVLDAKTDPSVLFRRQQRPAATGSN